MVREDAWYDFSFLKFIEVWFVIQDVILETIPCALEKKVYSSAFGWNVLKLWMKSISSNVSFNICVSSWIFCFDDLSTGVSGVVKSPTTIVLLSISPFTSVSVCRVFRCSYVGCIDIYNCYGFLLNWSLDHYVVSLSLVIFFILRSILSIWGLLLQLSFVFHLQEIYFSIFSLSVYMCLEI